MESINIDTTIWISTWFFLNHFVGKMLISKPQIKCQSVIVLSVKVSKMSKCNSVIFSQARDDLGAIWVKKNAHSSLKYYHSSLYNSSLIIVNSLTSFGGMFGTCFQLLMTKKL